jgi:hypothetical protein
MTVACSMVILAGHCVGHTGAQTDGIHGSVTEQSRQVNGLVDGC